MKFGDWHVWMVVVFGMLVPGLYLFRLHKLLLLDGAGAVITRRLFIAGAVLGVAIALWTRDRTGLGLAISLLSPLVHSIAFRRAFRWFVRVVGHEPVDVAYNWTPGLAPDRAFLFLVLSGPILLTMAAWGAVSWGIAVHPSGGTG